MGVVLLAAAGIIVKFMGFAYRVVLTNLPGYGDEGNGIYGAGFQIYLILYAFSATGFTSAISKLVAEKMALGDWRGAHKVFKVSFGLLFSIGLLFSALFLVSAEYIVELISNPRTLLTMVALSPTIFFVSIMASFKGYFQGMQNMSPQATSQIFEQLVKTLATIFLAYILMPYGVEMAAAGATAGTTIGAAAGAIYLWILYSIKKGELWANIRNFSVKKKKESTLCIVKNLIKISLPISFGAIIMTAANIIDLSTIMRLLAQAGIDAEDANRLYGILAGKCYVLANFPVSITMALSTSLVPAIAWAMAKKEIKLVHDKIISTIKLTLIICLPSSVGMAILAEPILMMLFPTSSEGAYLLSITAMTVVFTGLTQIFSGMLQGLGNSGIPALGLFLGAVIKLAINYTLIPISNINIKGAAYGTLACYVMATIVTAIGLKLNLRLKLDVQNSIIKPMVATILMGAATHYSYHYLFNTTGSNLIATLSSITISICIFFIALMISGAISVKELSRLPLGNNIIKLLENKRFLRR